MTTGLPCLPVAKKLSWLLFTSSVSMAKAVASSLSLKLNSRSSLIFNAFCSFLFAVASTVVMVRQTGNFVSHKSLDNAYLKATNVLTHPPQHLGTALITLTDVKYQTFALQLVASARYYNWTGSIYVLTINFESFSENVVRAFRQYGVVFIYTNAWLDNWLVKSVSNRKLFRHLNAFKFRKMELFYNPVFRTYRRLIYLDPDGLISSSLEPMVRVPFPHNVSVIMRQNDRSVKKRWLWRNVFNTRFLTGHQQSILATNFPDRSMSGATSWFIVDVTKLPSPTAVFSNSLQILCTFRAAFRLNDQTLLNLLFYQNLGFMPWCSNGEIVLLQDVDSMKKYCDLEMARQRKIFGRLKFMYRHMSSKEKATILSQRVTTDDATIKDTIRQVSEETDNVNGIEKSLLTSTSPTNNLSCIKAFVNWREERYT